MRTSNATLIAVIALLTTSVTPSAPARADASAAAMAASSAASAAAAAQVSIDMMNLDIRNRQERCEREIMRLSAMAPGPVDRDTLVSMAKENGCDLSSPGKKETLTFLAILLAGLAGAVAYERWDDRRRGWKA